jgi:hypothetical protein
MWCRRVRKQRHLHPKSAVPRRPVIEALANAQVAKNTSSTLRPLLRRSSTSLSALRRRQDSAATKPCRDGPSGGVARGKAKSAFYVPRDSIWRAIRCGVRVEKPRLRLAKGIKQPNR